MHKAVLFVFYDVSTGKILSERRPADHHTFPNMITFPTGSVEDGERVEDALVREAKEEFGIVPRVYISLPTLESHNTLLYPFWIKVWDGVLPDTVLDKGSKLIWETMDEASSSSVKTRAEVVQLLKDAL